MIVPPGWLAGDALKIWSQTSQTLARRGLLEHTDPEMLAAYCFCVINQYECRKRGDRDRARIWRGGALFSGNRLGLFHPIFVDFLDLLIDDTGGEVIFYLKPEWQITRPETYMTDPKPY